MEAKLQLHTSSDEPSKLPYQFIKEITNDFDEKRILGSGGFGTVYKGVHESRGDIAVKVLHCISGLDDKEFHKEFNNLRGLKHPNIVELVGFCKESEEELAEFDGKQVTAERLRMALCFEYVHNGSLNKLISDEKTGLTWHTRYRVIKGICEGLKYLREGLEYPIMHFDLKPDNILLDKSMMPKIADFGLSKLFGEENTKKTMSSAGTCGYWPPEYIKHQIISREFDIFSLGVIIIRIMTGHERYNSIVEMPTRKSVKLVHESWRKILRGTLSRTLLEVYCNQVKRCIEIALDCLLSNRQERPTIQDIVSSLNETETMIGGRGMQNEQGSDVPTIRRVFSTLPSDISNITINSRPPSENFPAVEPRDMPLHLLKKLTDNFSGARLLGEGGHGSVYKGVHGNGKVIAVKKLRIHRVNVDLFRREIEILMKVRHQNIVQFIGYCHESESVLTIYGGRQVIAEEIRYFVCFEYLRNGSLEKYISPDMNFGLNWQTRYKIIKGTCEGLRHLQEGLDIPILHMNLRPSNILMDKKMMPKIAGFGSARLLGAGNTDLTQSMMRTVEYLPPEFIDKQVISKEFDIYSLGIIILEVMTGKQSYHELGEMSHQKFIELAHEKWRERLQKTVDVMLVQGYCQQVKKCLEIAVRCVEADRHKRPAIGDIVQMLNETETGFIPQLDSELLLHVHPLELPFMLSSPLEVPRKKKAAMMSSSCSLKLDNKGNDRVAFMLVANSPNMYLTKEPLCGIVPPRCAYTLTLTMRNNKQPPSSDSGVDFLTLYSVVVGEYDLLDVDKGSVSTNYDKFFKKAGHEVQEVMLKVLCCQQQTDRGTSSETTRPTVEIITTPDAKQVSSIDVHPTEPWIMTTHNVGSLHVWNYKAMATMKSVQDVTDQEVHVAKFIAREKWVIAGDRNGCIHVYNYDEKEDVKSFEAHDSRITTLAVHPKYPFVLSSSDDAGLIKLWDWDKDWECTEFQGHTGRVTQVSFNTKDSDSFASASLDGTVKIWSIDRMTPVTLDHGNTITLKLKGPVDGYVPEGLLSVDYFTRCKQQHLIVGCKDRTAQIWKLGMKECVDELEGHTDCISAVILHLELPILITGSLDGTVRIWNSTTYKLENIIDFNLGAVYAFGCIKGSARLVVGCHQGIATIEISLPFPVINHLRLSSFRPDCSYTATGFIFSASRNKSGGGGIGHEKARKRRFLTQRAKNSASKLRHNQRTASAESASITNMTAKLNKAMACKFDISKASEGLVDNINCLSLLDKPDSFCDLSKNAVPYLRVEVSDGAAWKSKQKNILF